MEHANDEWKADCPGVPPLERARPVAVQVIRVQRTDGETAKFTHDAPLNTTDPTAPQAPNQRRKKRSKR